MFHPGKRRRLEGQAHIHSPLALHAHVLDKGVVGRRKIDDVEKFEKRGERRAAALPSLRNLSSDTAGDGVTVRVRFKPGTDTSISLRFASEDEVVGVGVLSLQTSCKCPVLVQHRIHHHGRISVFVGQKVTIYL